MVAPSDRFDELIDAFRPSLRSAWIPRAEANRMHLLAGKLTRRNSSQLGLFEDVEGRDRVERVAEVKRLVNEKLGRFMVRSGTTLHLPETYRDEANEYDICDVRGKVCF